MSLITGCATQGGQAEPALFLFAGGGADLLAGYRAWEVQLDTHGNFSVAKNVRGDTEEFGPYVLTAAENRAMWDLIEEIRFDRLASSSRPGIPDEVKYVFKLHGEVGSPLIELWAGEARQNVQLSKLIDQIRSLIEKYTGKRAILD
ncbi:MAG: hypothetical protein R3264_03640 [Anaerolineae bacterium]|nr:hypothetical protein [Anaerolineae bacterium]